MRKSLTELYENMLITEVLNAINYWVTPKGELLKLPNRVTHMTYAHEHFKDIDWKQYYADIAQGNVGWKDSYYVAYKAGYVRAVEQEYSIYVSYNRAKTPTKNQIATLINLAEIKEKNLYDEETGKVISKQNEIDSSQGSRQSLIKKLEQEMGQPSYYKNRPFGDSFSAYDLNDYTKIIYEYHIKEDEKYDDDEFGSYRMGMIKPKPLPDKPDYRQSMIDDAIEEIQLAKKNNIKGDPHYSLEGRIDFWIKFLHDNDFTQNEVEDIISMGLGDWNDFRK